MFCTVYVLRYLGGRILPSDSRYMRGRHGMLMMGKDRHYEMLATLHEIETGDELGNLHRATVLKVGHGGLLLAGYNVTYRGLKDKGDYFRQSWWCVPMTQVTLPASAEAPPAAPVDFG